MLWFVLPFQTQWFQCWRQFTWRKAKTLQRRWIGGIPCWQFVPNTKRPRFSIWSYLPSHFQAISFATNFKKTRNLVPYDLKLRDVDHRSFVCEQLHQRQERKLFLLHTVTGGEKWIRYSNSKRKSHGYCPLPGHASTSSAPLNTHAANVCSDFGYTMVVLFISSCWTKTKSSLGNGIQLSLFDWYEHCAKAITVQAESRQSDSTAMTTLSALHCETCQNVLRKLKWKFLTHPL